MSAEKLGVDFVESWLRSVRGGSATSDEILDRIDECRDGGEIDSGDLTEKLLSLGEEEASDEAS